MGLQTTLQIVLVGMCAIVGLAQPITTAKSAFSPQSRDELKSAINTCLKIPDDRDCQHLRLNQFKLERWFGIYEFNTPHLLCCSDTESFSQSEVIAMADEETKKLWENLSLGYTESQGLPLLRKQVAESLYNGYAGQTSTVKPDDVLIVTPVEGIMLAMQCLLSRGDHVVVMRPAYQSLYEHASVIGCRVSEWAPSLVDEGTPNSRWSFSLEDLRACFSRAPVQMLVVNFPHNPTGFSPTLPEWQAIVALCREHNCYLFSDEMYHGLSESVILPPAACVYEKAISLSGMSKVYSMPGIRIGWLTTTSEQTMTLFRTQKDYTTICSSAPSEILAIIVLRVAADVRRRNMEMIQRNKVLFKNFASRHPNLFRWIPYTSGSTGLMQFLGPEGATSFAKAAAESSEGVLLLPSAMFDFGDSFVRIGLGRDSEKTGAALMALSNFIENSYKPPKVTSRL